MTASLPTSALPDPPDWRDLPPDQVRPLYDRLVAEALERLQSACDLKQIAMACDLFPQATSAGEAVRLADDWSARVRAH